MKTAYSHTFTLTELMVVVVIIAIILALTLPAFSSMGTGNTVDAAARMVSAELMHARSEAISRRQKIAIILPTTQLYSDGVYNYASFRSAVVTGTATPYTFSDWVDNTEWAFLPTKSCIRTVDDSAPALIHLASTIPEKDEHGPDGYCLTTGTVTYPPSTDPTPTTVTGKGRAIIFDETGACPQNYYITIIEEAVDTTGPLDATINKTNFRVIQINQYTGKARFIY